MKMIKCKDLKKAIDYMTINQDGCYTIILDEFLILAIGFSDGYSNEDDNFIHAINDETYCLNGAIKCRNDFFCCDFDCLDFPRFRDGGVYSVSTTIAKDENIEKLTTYLNIEYKNIRKLIDKNILLID